MNYKGKSSMNKTIFHIVLSLATANLLYASSSQESGDDIESLLKDVSSIATKKSINVDYMPSVATIIDAQTFLDAGVQNISQALDMLPGFQEQISPMGYTISTVRGFKNPNAYFADKVKILVDGVAINNEVTGTASFYLDFPMHLVEKIEVLRGPASTMYGGGAYYGAVNIITKLGDQKNENQIYVGGGSYGAITAGTNLTTTQNGWNIFADGYAYSNDKSLYFNAYHSYNNGYTQEATKDYSVGVKATKDKWKFITRLKHENSGNYYSFEGGLNPIPDKPEDHSNIYLYSQLKYTTNFNDYELETKINYSHRNENIDANIANISSASKYYATRLDGFFSNTNIQEDNYGIESTLTLPEFASNDILLGVGASYDVVTGDNYFSSVENAIVQSGNMSTLSNTSNFDYNQENEPAYWLNPTATSLLPKGINRTNIYGYLQDLISINNDIDLIFGLRLDNYSDIGSLLSKRAGLVYRANDTITFKLLYGSAFRAPTFTEANTLGHINLRMGNSNIKPEECNTYEAGVVYTPNFYNKFVLNFYYTQLHNVIDLEELFWTLPGYQNYPNRESKGIEFEYFYKTNMTHNFYFNASYTKTDYATPLDTDTFNVIDNPSIISNMPDISKFMAKAIYIYKPTQQLALATAWRYFSQTDQTQVAWLLDEVNNGKFKSVIPEVHIFDETITYKLTHTSEVQASIKNLFNATVLQPAYYDSAHQGIQREGRNYMLTFTQKF